MTDTLPAAVIDAFGITDRGLVREGNEDHFLIARVSKAIEVRQTSMPSERVDHELGGAVGYVLAVADGVGGGPEGELASERTLATVLSYIGKATSCFQGLSTSAEHELLESWLVQEVEKGAKLPGLYPPNEENKKRYEDWKKKR